jgi:hypothetical protein
MSWKKAKEVLPEHNQQILVKHGINVDIAVFDKVKNRFVLQNGGAIGIDNELVWSELTRQNQ